MSATRLSRSVSLLAGALALAALLIPQGLAEEFRHWETAAGRKSSVRLKLVDREGDRIRLQREDNGRVVEMRIEQLGDADRRYLDELEDTQTTAVAAPAAATGDWPGWRGPRRDGLSQEQGLLAAWPEGGPKLAWQIRGLGDGYGAPAVAGGQLYLLGSREADECLLALDAADGHPLWETRLGTLADGGGYRGSRSTPTVDGDRLYALGSNGELVAARRDNGQLVWRHNLREEFGGSPGGWSYCESPLIDGQVLICTPGGADATLLALDKLSGQPLWRCSAKQLGEGYIRAAYASPIVAEIQGTKQYVQFLSGGVVGVRAADGQLLWNYDHPANGTANCSTPLCRGDEVFAASGYGTGGGKAKILGRGAEQRAEEQYFVRQLQNHHGGMVLVGDHIYGTNDQALLCVDWRTGEIAWQERSVGKGSVVYADGHLIVRSEGGPVALVAADPSGYQEHGRFDQPDRSGQNAWSHPVVAGGRLYLRDWDLLLCYELK